MKEEERMVGGWLKKGRLKEGRLEEGRKVSDGRLYSLSDHIEEYSGSGSLQVIT